MEGEEEEGQSVGTVGAGQSRDMGSLTGWQALANEVIAELGSGPQPGASQDQASPKGYEDEEEEMQVATINHQHCSCYVDSTFCGPYDAFQDKGND